VLRTLGRGRDEREVDLALSGIGQLNLGLFSGLGQALQSLLVLTKGLVLGCIEASDSESRLIFQHFFEIYTNPSIESN